MSYFRPKENAMNDLLSIYNEQNAFGRFMNMDYTIIDEANIEYKFQIRPEHIAINNKAHGGSIAAFMDAILGISGLNAVYQDGKYVSTVEFKINYLNPAALGDVLVGTGKVIRKGGRILMVEGQIENSQQLVATASGTLMAYPATKIL